MKPVYTVVLSSYNRVAGTHGDCQVEIRENLLQNNKKYLCKVKWIHLTSPEGLTTSNTFRSMYITIDGLYLDDIYHNTSRSNTPFMVLESSEWGPEKDILFEPSSHLRTVRVSQNILRVGFFDLETNGALSELIEGWKMELQFVEVDE